MTRTLQQTMVLAFCAVLLCFETSPVYGDSEPDFAKIKAAIVIVVGKGVVSSQGNSPIASKGTGFFVSKDGYLVTSYHIRTDLGAVDPRTVTYEIHFGTTSSEIVAAAPIYENPAADIMVLYAPIGDRDVTILTPGKRSDVKVGVTNVYTAGYPDGYQYSVDTGIVKSFGGTVDPIPAWTTSLNFKIGQSGSPILLANMRVIAIVKGNDADAATIGLVVPSRLVPDNFWDGTTSATSAAVHALLTSGYDGVSRISIEGLVPTMSSAKREVMVDLKNESCTGTSTKSFHVPASAGWTIDPATIEVLPTRIVGSGTKFVVTDRRDEGFTITAELEDVGRCITLPFGVTIASGISAEFHARAAYLEKPRARTSHLATFANAAVVGKVQTPLPNLPLDKLRFSLSTADGEVRAFVPTSDELVTKSGAQYLDITKAEARVRKER